jgi:cyclohexyl-isocyanide hydratase
MMNIGLLLYPGLTQLDLTSPFEVFARFPNTAVHVVWKNLEPVVADSKLAIVPNATFATCPALDLLMVPGGPGQERLMTDDETLNFVGAQGQQAKWVTSVCTGSLILGRAGLLKNYRAVTHWAYLELLPLFGAIVQNDRVVIDRNRITAGGVTAGIDFALHVAAVLHGDDVAKLLQLGIEYDPKPPFDNGHPRVANPVHVDMLRRSRFDAIIARQRVVIESNPRP